MRSTALITVLSGAAMAAPKHPGSKDAAYNGVIYAPPVTTTVTETTTEYDTITEYETTRTAHYTAFATAPPVTATVTEYVGELYDQSYGNGYELGDVIVAPTVVTETKIFTLFARGNKHKPTTTELVKEWSIGAAPGVATVTQFTSTAWVDEHATSTVWVDAEPTDEPDEDSDEESDEEHPENPPKTIELEDGYGGLKEPETGSKFHVIDVPEDDEPSAEEFEELLAKVWKAEQEAAEKAAQEAAKKILDQAAKSEKPHESSSSSTSQLHTPSRPHAPTPTHSTPFHTPSASPPPKPSSFATKPSAQAPKPQPSVFAGPWHGKLLNTTDGSCGLKGGQIAWSCHGNQRGSCCSEYGHCGSEAAHCGVGCQSAFGDCASPAAPILYGF
jgi:hypothetical protein